VEYDAATIIDHLRIERYSVLDTIGCQDIRKEANKLRWACKTVLWFAERTAWLYSRKREEGLRIALHKILEWGAPSEIVRNNFPSPGYGLVFGFNHPTLGEILRLVSICVSPTYRERKALFPVNFAWYEALAPMTKRIEAFGIYITPIITPSGQAEILKRVTDERIISFVDGLAKKLNYRYLDTCIDFISSDDIVVVAPSATRQATVFRSKKEHDELARIEPPTMSLLAAYLRRSRRTDDYCFLPIAIKPPKKYSRGLNLFKRYTIIPCDRIHVWTIERLLKQKNRHTNQCKFEHYFLSEIAAKLPLEMIYPSQQKIEPL
jgi:hypothetical protein